MNYMFYKCEKLKFAPDLNSWNLKKCLYMSHIFEECNSLIMIPNIPLMNKEEENLKNNDNILYENFLNVFNFNKFGENNCNNEDSLEENPLDNKIEKFKFENGFKFIN